MSDTNDWNKTIIEEFRANEGRVGGQFADVRLILLHTKGAKSGQPRLNPAVCLEDNDRLVVIASKAGAPSNPDWYYNLVANPEIDVEYGTEQFRVRATVAQEPERTELYGKMAAIFSSFAEYQKNTTRAIPVVILTRLS